MCVCVRAHVRTVVSESEIPWTIVCQDLLFMEFSRQEYWSGLPCPPPGELPDPGTEPAPLESPVLAGGSLITAPPGKGSKQLITT